MFWTKRSKLVCNSSKKCFSAHPSIRLFKERKSYLLALSKICSSNLTIICLLSYTASSNILIFLTTSSMIGNTLSSTSCRFSFVTNSLISSLNSHIWSLWAFCSTLFSNFLKFLFWLLICSLIWSLKSFNLLNCSEYSCLKLEICSSTYLGCALVSWRFFILSSIPTNLS